MKKVCVVTSSRSEYGLLRWLLQELDENENIQLELLVAGSHLSSDYGLTYKEIEADGFLIDKKIEFLLSTSTSVGIAKSMGVCAISISDAFNDLSPDMIVVLGDRYELLPICSVALVMGIPIAHISGGDITEGAIDNQIRNAITMLADLHFPGNDESKVNIERMRGSNKSIFNVGEPGLDSFNRLNLMKRDDIANSLGISVNKKWVLMTLHPETKSSVEYSLLMANILVDELEKVQGIDVIITGSNADLGGTEINEYFKRVSKKSPKFHYFKSLGHKRYLATMKESWCLVGNSSSGIVEAPFLGIPVINIGERQKGRHLCKNVLSVVAEREAIYSALLQVELLREIDDPYYGDGNSSRKIAKLICNYLYNI